MLRVRLCYHKRHKGADNYARVPIITIIILKGFSCFGLPFRVRASFWNADHGIVNESECEFMKLEGVGVAWVEFIVVNIMSCWPASNLALVLMFRQSMIAFRGYRFISELFLRNNPSRASTIRIPISSVRGCPPSSTRRTHPYPWQTF